MKEGQNFYLSIIFILVVIDQLIKWLVRIYLTPQSYIEVIPHFIHLTHQENKGISFSFLGNLPDLYRVPLLVGISLIVICGLMYYLYRHWEKVNVWERWGYSMILAGAFGNLIDRAVRHSVTDYMFFHFYNQGFFVNNFADDLISVGFVLLVLVSFKKKEP